MILVDSIYINDSGGKVLLDYFINTLIEKNLTHKFYFLLDSRGNYNYLDKISSETANSSEISRIKFYISSKNKFSKIFCLSNVPPPVKCSAPVYTYFHNALLAKTINSLPVKSKIIKLIKRQYIRYKSNNTDYFVVQTDHVKELIEKNISSNVKIKVLPFFHLEENHFIEKLKQPEFVYISNANPHKNHENLLKAWLELKRQGITPKLHLTITEKHSSVLLLIDKMISNGVDIENHGYVNINDLLSKSSFLIYPSLSESFGLGLIESVNAGLNVLASDLPYVRQVIQPTMVFDPYNINSIVETTKKALDSKSLEKSEILVKNKIEDLLQTLLN